MGDIKYIFIFIVLTFNQIHGDYYFKCEKEYETYMGCPVYKIESQYECEIPLMANYGEGNFIFYIKPLLKGDLSISLDIVGAQSTHREIAKDIFDIEVDANRWYKIKIIRDKAPTKYSDMQFEFQTYYLKVNGEQVAKCPNQTEVGNQIRMQTVAALWSFDCDPRQYQPTPQPTFGLAMREENNTTNSMPTWLLVIVAVATLLIILVTLLLVLRYRRRNRDPALIQSTDHKSRLSRHVSENSRYASYDNHGTEEDQVPSIVGPHTGTDDINTANQKRGSDHDSENSLYIGVN
ncbi:unnamed protein product [Meganyctiphanes norvegica]|uniref:Uncharacterized protein n=1 Tax=Meganyctiphanes norvegica TaxID=48144 RepID=A0AAV2PPV8_MEGNR